MFWKKVFCLVLILSLMLPLASCGQQSQDNTTQTVQTVFSVGLCVRRYEDAPAYYDAVVAALERNGYQVWLEDSKNDQSRQNNYVRTLIAAGAALLIVEPVMVSALDSVISQAQDAGLPLMLLDREPEAAVMDSYDKLCFIGCESAGAGTAQAQLLDKINLRGDLNEDGTVSYMILSGPEDHMDARLITEACIAQLEQSDTEHLCTVYSDWDLAAARAVCAQTLSRYGRDIEVIFCNDPRLALGAAEAVENGGWSLGQDVYVIAVGTNDKLEERISTGDVFATVAPESEQRVNTIVRLAQAMLEGEAVEKYHYVPYTLITAQTLKAG